MELAEKVLETLSRSIPVEYARLEEDDGITGFVVSPRFLGMTSLDRQGLIESTLTASPDLISPQEYRQVLMIAAVTPDEYDSVGARIRVHEVNEQADGGVEILLYGKPNDAEYVRGVVNKIQGVDATSPKQEPRAKFLMTFFARSTGDTPLSKTEVVRALEADRYIQIVKEQ